MAFSHGELVQRGAQAPGLHRVVRECRATRTAGLLACTASSGNVVQRWMRRLWPAPASSGNGVQRWTAGLLACIDVPQSAMPVNPRVTRPRGTAAVIDAGESARRRCAPAGREVTCRLRVASRRGGR